MSARGYYTAYGSTRICVTNGPRVILNSIHLGNICKDHGDGQVVDALRDINLAVAQGERVAIMEPSGSGESSSQSFHCSQTNHENDIDLLW